MLTTTNTMASSNEVSKKALEDIKALLGNLNDDNVWDLINEIRDRCSVVIPVWFTPTLVEEITEESLGVRLKHNKTIDIIERANDNDMSYTLGRKIVEELIRYYLFEDMNEEDNQSDDETDSEKTDD